VFCATALGMVVVVINLYDFQARDNFDFSRVNFDKGIHPLCVPIFQTCACSFANANECTSELQYMWYSSQCIPQGITTTTLLQLNIFRSKSWWLLFWNSTTIWAAARVLPNCVVFNRWPAYKLTLFISIFTFRRRCIWRFQFTRDKIIPLRKSLLGTALYPFTLTSDFENLPSRKFSKSGPLRFRKSVIETHKQVLPRAFKDPTPRFVWRPIYFLKQFLVHFFWHVSNCLWVYDHFWAAIVVCHVPFVPGG
jgi:hypothetical protein